MYTTPEEVMEGVWTLINNQKLSLGLKFVGYGEDKVIPAFPAVLVSGGPLDRVIHGTHKFQADIRAVIWVYHARMTEDHKTRTKNDLLLATAIRELIHGNMTLDHNIVYGFIDSEVPGQINRAVGDSVVGTRMTYMAITQETF